MSPDEVLLLWRAVSAFRGGRHPACEPRGPRPRSPCPLVAQCPRLQGPDDWTLSLSEELEATERRSAWPCNRLLDLLGPDTHTIGR